MPSKQEVLAAIASGELFTDEYQEACRQRKAAVLLERSKRAKQDNDFYTKLWEENKAKREAGDAFQSMGEDLNTFLDAFTVTQGVDMTALSVSMPQIAEFAQWNMNEFCAALGGIPSTELTGTLTGDRASTENGKVMAMLADGRRNQVLNNDILDFVAFLQGLGCWTGKEFDVSWPDLLTPSPLDRMMVVDKMADVNNKSITTVGVVFDSNKMMVAGGYEPEKEDMGLQKEVDDLSAEMDKEE